MKKRYLFAGLFAGVLGYWYLQREKTAEMPSPPQATISRAEEVPSEPKVRYRPNRAVAVLPPASASEDEYRRFLNSIDFHLSDFYQEPSEEECAKENEANFLKMYRWALLRYSRDVDNDPTIDSDPMSIDALLATDQLADVQIKWANCFHLGGGSWERLIRDVADRYARVQDFGGAAQACYAAGDRECALDNLVAGGTKCADKAIALAREEELPDLLDWYFDHGDLLSAGKVEWVNGDKERAQELILQSPEFRRADLVAIKLIAQGLYTEAFRQFRDLKIPFFRDIAQKLCLQDEACRQELQEYNAQDEDFFSVDGC